MTTRPAGPVEAAEFPAELEAYVVTPGDDPRLHGYAVEGDLAPNAGFVETLLLSLTGELPGRAELRAFELALTFLAPVSVAEAPAHATVLARICGARSSSVAAIAAVTLLERARALLAAQAALFAWLAAPASVFPPECRACSDAERASVTRLRALLGDTATAMPAAEHDPGRTAALLALLHFAGLRRPEQLEPVFLLASLAPVVAEAFPREVASFRRYPMRLPPFAYEEDERA